MVQDDPDVSSTFLHALNGLPEGCTDPAGFNGVDLIDQPMRLIGQLTDDLVPFCETLVAAMAVWEGSGEPSSADVTPWS